MTEKISKYDLIIVGAGPAGLTASIYASRFGIENFVIGSLAEGRLAEANEVGNFPPEAEISGLELVEKMKAHAEGLGTEVRYGMVEKIRKEDGGLFSAQSADGKKFFAKTVLIAIGSKRKKLDVPGEKEFFGKGLSYCAVCDGGLFKNKRVAVIGGSGAAATTADYLSGLAEKVYLIHEGAQLKADKVWREKVKNNHEIDLLLKNQVEELKGGNFLESAVLENDYQGERELKIDGIFIETGLEPDLSIVDELGIETDEDGFVDIQGDGSTNVTGIWAAGDITNGSNNFRQIVTASAEGAVAASSIQSFLIKAEEKWN